MLLLDQPSKNAESYRQTADLLYTWTSRQIRSRYQQSLLGWLWAIAQPVAQAAVFAVVFTKLVPVSTGGIPYVLFSYVALGPWTFLSTALTDMTNSIVENMSLVTKIYFRREVLPLSAMLARLLDFAVSSVVTVALVLCYRTPVDLWRFAALLPLALLIQMLLITGLGLACAAANTFLRDVRPLIALVLQLWFYASPIIYPVDKVPQSLRGLYALNPAVGMIEAYRAAWLNTPVPASYIWSAGIVACLCMLGGYWLFRRSEALFADII